MAVIGEQTAGGSIWSEKVDSLDRECFLSDNTTGDETRFSIASECPLDFVNVSSPLNQKPPPRTIDSDVPAISGQEGAVSQERLPTDLVKSTTSPSSLPPDPSGNRRGTCDDANISSIPATVHPGLSSSQAALGTISSVDDPVSKDDSSLLAGRSSSDGSLRSRAGEYINGNLGNTRTTNSRSPSLSPLKSTPSPVREEAGDTSFALPRSEKAQSRTFADMLAGVTMRAPEKLAEKLAERLQQTCQEDASSGRYYSVFDAPLPLSRRVSDTVAREFAAKLKDLGFARFEWWSGKDWREMSGRYIILHDTMYDKYSMRVRVHWPEGLAEKDIAETEATLVEGRQEHVQEDIPLETIVQQLQQVLKTQTELVLQSIAAQEAAEKRIECAEARALVAENLCLNAGVSSNYVRQLSLSRKATGEYHNQHRSCFAGCLEAFGTRRSASAPNPPIATERI